MKWVSREHPKTDRIARLGLPDQRLSRSMPLHPARIASAVLVMLVLLVNPAEVRADARLVEAQPPSGATVSMLTEVVLRFDQALIASKSSLELRVGDTTIARGGVSSGDPNALRLSVTSPQPGDYEVRYVAGSQDGHLVRGTYRFSLLAPTPPPPPTVSPTLSLTAPPSVAVTTSPIPVPTLALSPTLSPSPTPAPASAADVVVPILAALGLVAIAGTFLLRRGRGA